MLNASQLEGGWQQLLSRVGPVEELEASAKASGALLRRREIRNAADLLRLALAYGPGGMSLRAVAAWAHTMRLGELSDVAALKRLRGCAPWLQEIVGNMLARQLSCQPVMQGRIIRLVDGTTLSERGSDRADWRLHYSYDPRRGRTVECELTTAAVGACGGSRWRRATSGWATATSPRATACIMSCRPAPTSWSASAGTRWPCALPAAGLSTSPSGSSGWANRVIAPDGGHRPTRPTARSYRSVSWSGASRPRRSSARSSGSRKRPLGGGAPGAAASPIRAA